MLNPWTEKAEKVCLSAYKEAGIEMTKAKTENIHDYHPIDVITFRLYNSWQLLTADLPTLSDQTIQSRRSLNNEA